MTKAKKTISLNTLSQAQLDELMANLTITDLKDMVKAKRSERTEEQYRESRVKRLAKMKLYVEQTEDWYNKACERFDDAEKQIAEWTERSKDRKAKAEASLKRFDEAKSKMAELEAKLDGLTDAEINKALVDLQKDRKLAQ